MSLFRKITETVSKGLSSATEKAQQTVEATRLHSQISGKRKEIDALFTEIGSAVFDGYLAKDLSVAESKVIPLCEEIVAIRSEIDVLDERIMQLRNEKECVCGRKVSYDTRFCPSCGHPFPEPARPSAEASVAPVNNLPYDDEFPSADPFAEPPGIPESADSPSAADWADVGKPVWEERPETGFSPRGGRASAAESDGPDREAGGYVREAGIAGELPTETAVCPGCGQTVDPSAHFCPSCGTPQS